MFNPKLKMDKYSQNEQRWMPQRKQGEKIGSFFEPQKIYTF